MVEPNSLDPARVEEIARGLSPTMRDAVRWSPWTDRVGRSVTNKTSRALRARGVLEDDNREFTKLGLALYAYLQKDQSDEG